MNWNIRGHPRNPRFPDFFCFRRICTRDDLVRSRKEIGEQGEERQREEDLELLSPADSSCVHPVSSLRRPWR